MYYKSIKFDMASCVYRSMLNRSNMHDFLLFVIFWDLLKKRNFTKKVGFISIFSKRKIRKIKGNMYLKKGGKLGSV
jgi:hypothetical protein